MTEGPLAELFTVGTIVGFHGLCGEVKVRPETNAPELVLDIESAVVRPPDGRELSLSVKNVRLDRRMLFLLFGGYESRTSVEEFAGAAVLAPRAQLRALDDEEFWISDLVGLSAFTTEGLPIGKVVSIIDGGNQLLEIGSGDGKTILVPFVRALVPKVDLRTGRLEVAAIPGLLEPQ